MAILKAKGLWQTTAGMDKPPTDTNSNEHIAWTHCNDTAFAQIISNVSDNVLQLVTSCETAPQVWSALKNNFRFKSKFTKSLALEAFYTCSMAEGDNLRDYLNKLQSL